MLGFGDGQLCLDSVGTVLVTGAWDSAPRLGAPGDRPAQPTSTVARGLVVATNVVVSPPKTSTATSSVGPTMQDLLGNSPLLIEE